MELNEYVLLVDDEVELLDLYEFSLDEAGYKVISCESASDAIEKVEQNEIFLVITDFKMPGMTGDEMAKKIKSINPDIPIVMVTGYAKDPRLGLSLDELGVKDILSKPFEPEDIVALARRFANERINQLAKGDPMQEDMID